MAEQTIGVITPVHAKTEEDVKWLCEAIKSVIAQEVQDWRMVVVNDHSEVDLKSFRELRDLFKDSRITGARTDVPGVANARNLAVATVEAGLLLPLDHDDWFPENAFSIALREWNKGGREKGIVHGDILLYQNNSQRIHPGHPYNFQLLLSQLFMPIGCLHSKAAWAKVGGWKPEMNLGLEDWEYWIALGEAGVCGHYVPEVLYVYRRHARGRLAHLRTDPERFSKAQVLMRELHAETYAGRYPMGCCNAPAVQAPQGGPAPRQSVREQMAAVSTDKLVQVQYIGGMKGGTFVEGRPSGIRYSVPGTGQRLRMPDGREGVDPRDLPWITGMDRGQSFRRE